MTWDKMDPAEPCTTCIAGSSRKMCLQQSFPFQVPRRCRDCSHHNPAAKALQWSPKQALCNGCGAKLTPQGYDYNPDAPVDAGDATLCGRCAHNALKKLDDLRKALGAGDEWWTELGKDGDKRHSPLARLQAVRQHKRAKRGARRDDEGGS